MSYEHYYEELPNLLYPFAVKVILKAKVFFTKLKKGLYLLTCSLPHLQRLPTSSLLLPAGAPIIRSVLWGNLCGHASEPGLCVHTPLHPSQPACDSSETRKLVEQCCQWDSTESVRGDRKVFRDRGRRER